MVHRTPAGLQVRFLPAATACEITTCVSLQALRVHPGPTPYNAQPPDVPWETLAPDLDGTAQNLSSIRPEARTVAAHCARRPPVRGRKSCCTCGGDLVQRA